MLRKIPNETMGRGNHGWLKSVFHFSFADYYNPENINFGVLRVLNDDLVEEGTGFDMHPHDNMEILSYVVEGELTHGDSMGNKKTITRGDIQYMSAGTGVIHSEFNNGQDNLRFLQMWIYPDRKNHIPDYGDHLFKWEDRKNKWLHMVSGKEGTAPININQDANVYVIELDKDKEISFPVDNDRQAYLVQIEGSSKINKIQLFERDALEIVEEGINIRASETSHILIIEMAK
ncbi:pirin family protein [Clostridium polynesiense]|uniref:pirin family protein n=1 Tax=Clostridium polynesiense TaxID=1325933 RepID=UPI00058DE9FF|nr:pirin family protein [Clostridium polynesiense]